jgi:hypothetical protein
MGEPDTRARVPGTSNPARAPATAALAARAWACPAAAAIPPCAEKSNPAETSAETPADPMASPPAATPMLPPAPSPPANPAEAPALKPAETPTPAPELIEASSCTCAPAVSPSGVVSPAMADRHVDGSAPSRVSSCCTLSPAWAAAAWSGLDVGGAPGPDGRSTSGGVLRVLFRLPEPVLLASKFCSAP